jgi:hypothetical protein
LRWFSPCLRPSIVPDADADFDRLSREHHSEAEAEAVA